MALMGKGKSTSQLYPTGFKRRAVMVGNRNYLGREFKSLTVTPVNDVKDMTSALQDGGFGLENTYENVASKEHFEEILRTYVDAVNKEPEEIEMLVFYYAGLGIQGLLQSIEELIRSVE